MSATARLIRNLGLPAAAAVFAGFAVEADGDQVHLARCSTRRGFYDVVGHHVHDAGPRDVGAVGPASARRFGIFGHVMVAGMLVLGLAVVALYSLPSSGGLLK